MVQADDIRAAITTLQLQGKPVCAHVSLRSFGHVEGGAQTVIDAFLAQGCTLIVPTFSSAFEVPPPRDGRPQRNGIDYGAAKFATHRQGEPYSVFSPSIDDNMGRVADTVVQNSGRVRGKHGLCSFSGLGPLAQEIIGSQGPRNVFAPLKNLAKFRGTTLLVGVDLTRMSLLSLAEHKAGREPFVRWSNGPARSPLACQVGSCPRGYKHFEPFIAPLAQKISVGLSVWRAFPARETLEAAVEVILRNPRFTHCGDPMCLRCNDAVAGGPLELSE